LSNLRKYLSWIVPSQLEKVKGELGHNLEVNVQNGRVLLDTANVNYSFGALQDVFDYAFTKTNLYDAKINSVLLLGFGSGSVAELLQKKNSPDILFTGVEADGEVIRLAKKYFPVSNHQNVTIVHDSAEHFVQHCKESFDLIVIDIFLEDKVPATCQSKGFLQSVQSLLSRNGKVYFNKMAIANDEVKTVRVNRGGAENVVFVAAL
jgi:spermidine synthase